MHLGINGIDTLVDTKTLVWIHRRTLAPTTSYTVRTHFWKLMESSTTCTINRQLFPINYFTYNLTEDIYIGLYLVIIIQKETKTETNQNPKTFVACKLNRKYSNPIQELSDYLITNITNIPCQSRRRQISLKYSQWSAATTRQGDLILLRAWGIDVMSVETTQDPYFQDLEPNACHTGQRMK